jgi:hypothetical protein
MKLSFASSLLFALAFILTIRVQAATVCNTTLKYFTLYNGDTDKSVQNITAGGKICTPSYKVNFEASYGPCASDPKNPIKKVWLALCKVEGKCASRIEKKENYFVFGNNGTQVNGRSIENGAYILTAKAYNGTAWTKKSDVEFTVGACTRNLRFETDM